MKKGKRTLSLLMTIYIFLIFRHSIKNKQKIGTVLLIDD